MANFNLIAEAEQSIHDHAAEEAALLEVMTQPQAPSMVEQPQPFLDAALNYLVNKKITSPAMAQRLSDDDINAISALRWMYARYAGNMPEKIRNVQVTPAQLKRQLLTIANMNAGAQGIANQFRQFIAAGDMRNAAQFVNNAVNDYVNQKAGQKPHQPQRMLQPAQQSAPNAPAAPTVGRNQTVPATTSNVQPRVNVAPRI